jgi:hypothetical protein
VPLRLVSFGLVALLPLPVSAASAAEDPSKRSAHWKTTVTLEGSRAGQALQEAEVWLLGGRMRIDERGTENERTNVLQSGAEVYIWVEGRTHGVKLAPGLAARGRPLHTFVRRAAEIRARGKRTGEQIVDGHPCEIFEFESREEGKGTYWLARDLGDFPVKAILERRLFLPYSGKPVASDRVEYRNRDIRIGGPIPADRLEPPAGVQFQDATEIFLNRTRPAPR